MDACFRAYQQFETKRVKKENFYVLTETKIEVLILQFDANADGMEEFFSKLRSTVGNLVIDNGVDEALEAIAAAEIAYALAVPDFRRIPEDGAFLRTIQLQDASRMLQRTDTSLGLIGMNKPLLKEMGNAWKRNLSVLRSLVAQRHR